jgi:hypothetical protein
MPAIWLLNARSPTTQQYGNCSCWASGCGEIDLFEVLTPGGDKAKSNVHYAVGEGGGDANWFERPVDDGGGDGGGGSVRVAVVLDGERGEVTVWVLGRGVAVGGEVFPEGLGLGEGGVAFGGEGSGMRGGQGVGSLFKMGG